MVSKIFNNSIQIEDYFNSILKQIIRNVGVKMLEDFQKHLDETIYSPPEGDYMRYYKNGGFYSGWHLVALDDFEQALMFDPSRLIEHSQDWVNNFIAHGGNVNKTGRDYRKDMPMILNDSNLNGFYSVAGGAFYPRHSGNRYWDKYIQEINKKIQNWFDDEFKKYGIKRG